MGLKPVACGPVHTLADLNRWQPPGRPLDSLTKASVPLPLSEDACRTASARSKQRLLFCHDMAGGYLDDKWAQGCTNSAAFLFEFWQCVDVFIYFSHAMVAIPPVGWINAAHRNSARVLGTFILEWEEGTKVCQELFKSRESATHAAKQLGRIAQWFGFDGWLVNIESKVKAEHVPHIVLFLEALKSEMHTLVQGRALVLWYDACDVEGQVRHYCTVNHCNFPFMEATDGLFVDYHWNDTSCRTACEFLEARQRASGDDGNVLGPADAWFGVDVYGRGTYCGGKWNSDIGVAHAGAAGMSVAMFAPAWVCEEEAGEPKAAWPQRCRRLWRLVQDAWMSTRVTVTSLPLCTSFNRGSGSSYTQGGKGIGDGWFNLSLQDLQPLWLPPSAPSMPACGIGALRSSPECSVSILPDHERVFEGGCSVHCSGSCVADGTALSTIFFCDAEAPDTLTVQYACQVAPGTAAGLVLLFAERDDPSAVLLQPATWKEGFADAIQLHLLSQVTSCEVIACTGASADQALESSVQVDNWETHRFQVTGPPASKRRLMQIAIATCAISGNEQVSMHLGSLLIHGTQANLSAAVTGLQVCGDVSRGRHHPESDAVALLLEWQCPGMHTIPGAQRFAVWACEDEGEPQDGVDANRTNLEDAKLVGFTGRCMYHVCPLLVPLGARAVTLVVQSRGPECLWGSLSSSASVTVTLPDV